MKKDGTPLVKTPREISVIESLVLHLERSIRPTVLDGAVFATPVQAVLGQDSETFIRGKMLKLIPPASLPLVVSRPVVRRRLLVPTLRRDSALAGASASPCAPPAASTVCLTKKVKYLFSADSKWEQRPSDCSSDSPRTLRLQHDQLCRRERQ